MVQIIENKFNNLNNYTIPYHSLNFKIFTPERNSNFLRIYMIHRVINLIILITNSITNQI